MRKFLFLLLAMLPIIASAADELPLWLVNTKFNGDFRYRHEGIDKENSAATYRNRIRYRLGLQTTVNDKVKAGARFASGTGDPRSTNQNLEDGLSAKPINLDRAYFELTPSDHWWVTGGKVANPYVSTDLQWDTDVNFEGGVAKYSMGEKTKVAFTGGAIWIQPYKDGHGAGIWAGQISASGAKGDTKWNAAAGMWSYVLGGANDQTLNLVGYGNTMESGIFQKDFEILDVVAEVTMPVAKSKLTVTVNPVLNTATSTDNVGWLAMAKIKGKVWKRASSISYDYRVLEPDAVFGAFTDSDAAGGRTNQRGHRIMGDLELIDGFTVGGSAYFNTLSASGDGPWYQRWMLDGSVKF
jgi:hypothetical protein